MQSEPLAVVEAVSKDIFEACKYGLPNYFVSSYLPITATPPMTLGISKRGLKLSELDAHGFPNIDND